MLILLWEQAIEELNLKQCQENTATFVSVAAHEKKNHRRIQRKDRQNLNVQEHNQSHN
jgi:hypothetical protein